MAAGRRRFQVDLSSIVAAPFLFAPSLVGFGIADRFVRGGVDLGAVWPHLLAVVLIYVVFFCWLATRRFDRRSSFRKFPFRGSMLLGAVIGPCFAIQFALGAQSAVVAHDAAAFANVESMFGLLGFLFELIVQSLGVGGFVGACLGLLAGGGYCVARRLRESLTGCSTIRPGQAKRRLGVE